MKVVAKRCALYTRKSTDEGLDQAFNSLDAQREACASYVKSQAGEGWRALPQHYDDGGFSGGSMERPALKTLLADIEAGLVDVVVVYKIDRLTRSLADFARMVELFDRCGVSFVSVTQSFNTTTSMGRLTLNVLLSFAQFEREVTGERIRDKIAASKARGMWMGGNLPLGYDTPTDGSRILVVNDDEAATVRRIFALYLELGSVHALQNQLSDEGVLSKQRITAKGRTIGGQPFSRGALFHLLRNRIYIGMIMHKGQAHSGAHAAIIDQATFDAVQGHLDGNARRHNARREKVASMPLTGRIFDADGNPMSPTFSHGKGGRLYRYYVSAPLQQGAKVMTNVPRRVPASRLEELITDTLARAVTQSSSPTPLAVLKRVEVHADAVHLLLPRHLLTNICHQLKAGEQLMPNAADATASRLVIPTVLHRAGGRVIVAGPYPAKPSPDPVLIKALRAAHKMVDLDEAGLPILTASPNSPYLRKLVRLAFLAPDLQRAILEGRQPPNLKLEHLIHAEHPLTWSRQAEQIAALAGSGAR